MLIALGTCYRLGCTTIGAQERTGLRWRRVCSYRLVKTLTRLIVNFRKERDELSRRTRLNPRTLERTLVSRDDEIDLRTLGNGANTPVLKIGLIRFEGNGAYLGIKFLNFKETHKGANPITRFLI